jgi:hypothetical protein
VSQEKYWALIEKLARLTGEGKADWKITTDSRAFLLSFANFSVQVGVSEYFDRGPDYELCIFNANGDMIERIADHQFEEGGRAFNELKALHDAARRQALGVENALDSILTEISGALGEPRNK